MKCSHTGHPSPHRLLLFLTQGIGPLSPFHNLGGGGYHPLERIITSFSLPWGIITPQRELSPLTRYPGGLSPPHLCNHALPWGLPTPRQSDLPLFPTIILVQLFPSIVRVMGWEH